MIFYNRKGLFALYKLIHLVLGYITIKLCGDNALAIINTLNGEGKKFFSAVVGENCFYISCSVFSADGLEKRLKDLGADYSIEKRSGLSFLVYRYKKRVGLLVGMALAMLIVYGSTRVIWDVRVDCNGDYDRVQVQKALSRLGVESGKRIGDIDVYKTELSFLVQNPQFSDMALNIQGTVAVVKLRVRTESPRQEQKSGVYDVIAAEAGIIQSVSAIKGAPAVKRGDTVAKGDLLISGVMQGAYGEYYLHHACGSVTATVYRDFFTIIPLSGSDKMYTGNEKAKCALTVLGKRISLFFNEFSPYELADVETETKPVSLWGIKLPIVKETVTYKEYTVQPTTVSVEEATLQAKAAFKAYLEREVKGEIISASAECEYNEQLNAVLLDGTAEVITEIGVEVEMKNLPETVQITP